jgi:hypothetical protein
MMEIHDMSVKFTSPVHHIFYLKKAVDENCPVKNYTYDSEIEFLFKVHTQTSEVRKILRLFNTGTLYATFTALTLEAGIGQSV